MFHYKLFWAIVKKILLESIRGGGSGEYTPCFTSWLVFAYLLHIKDEPISVLNAISLLSLYPPLFSSSLFVCLSVCLFVFLSVCLFVCLSVCLFVCLSVCLLVCLSVCLFASIYTVCSCYFRDISIRTAGEKMNWTLLPFVEGKN